MYFLFLFLIHVSICTLSRCGLSTWIKVLIDWLTKRGWGRNTRTDSDGRPLSGRVGSCRPPSKKSNERDNIRFIVTCYEYVCQCEILHSIRIFYVGCLVHRIDFYGLVTLTKTANTDAPSLHSCALQRVARGVARIFGLGGGRRYHVGRSLTQRAPKLWSPCGVSGSSPPKKLQVPPQRKEDRFFSKDP